MAKKRILSGTRPSGKLHLGHLHGALANWVKLQEEYERFQRDQPRVLGREEREAIQELAADIPSLWSAPSTTSKERKEILR